MQGLMSENSIDVLKLQNQQKINQNSEYFEAGKFRNNFFSNLLLKSLSKFFKDDFTTVKQLEIPLKYPTACNLGLWGGESLLSGYITHFRNASRGQ